MSNRRAYTRNTAWVLFDKFFGIIITLVVGILLARYLGPEQMGLWGYVQAVIAIITVVSLLGVEPIAIRDMVPDDADCAEILGSVLMLRVAGSIVGFLAAIAWLNFSPDPRIKGLLLLLAITNVIKIFESYDYLFQAKIMSKHGVWARVIWQIFSGGGKIILIWSHGSLIMLGVITLCAAIVQSIVFCQIGKRIYRLPFMKLKVRYDRIRLLARDSWPLLLSGIATVIYLEIDKIMLQSMAGNETVGHYSVAVRISTVAVFLIPGLCQSLYPAIIRAKKVGRGLYESRLAELYSITLWLGILIGGGLAAFSSLIIPAVFGREYSAAIPILQVLGFTGVFSAITLVSAQWLMIERLQIYSFQRNVAGMVINIVLNFILIPLWGGVGAAVASMGARAISTLGFMVLKAPMHMHLFLVFKALIIVPMLKRRTLN